MKEYILKKYKVNNKYSVFGRGDEQRKRQIALQANADRVGDQFTRLTPPFSADLKLSTAELSACDLISEGPIEGFVNVNGESCSALEATYLDGTVVAEPLLSKKTIENLTTGKLSGVFYNFKPFVTGQLDSYARELESRFVHKEYPTSESKLGSVGSYGAIDAVAEVSTILACQGGSRPLNTIMSWNTNGYDQANTRRLNDSFMSAIKAGHGYRKNPFQYRRIYHANIVKPGSSYAIPSTYNYTDTTNPILYQGNYGFGNAINSSGRLSKSYCTRAFVKTLHISTETAYSNSKYSNFVNYVATAMSYNSSFASRFPNGRPSKYRYSLASNYEPEGLKEPLIDALAKKINDLGFDYWKPYRFYNSDPNVISNLAVPSLETTATVYGYSTDGDLKGYVTSPYSVANPRYPSGLYNVFNPGTKSYTNSTSVQRDKLFRRKTVISNKDADKFISRWGNQEISLTEYGTYSDSARLYKPNVTYRFTGSIYIPSANDNVNVVKFQLVDNGGKTVFSITGSSDGSTDFSFDQWNDFDVEYANNDFRRLKIRMYENNSNPGANASGDFFALNDFTVLEKTTANAAESSSDFAYMAFSADDFFGTNFNKDYELTFSVDGERLEIEDKNGLGCVYPEVTGFDLRSRSVKESFVKRHFLISYSQCGYYDGGYRMSQRFPIITGASNATSIGAEITEAKSNKFKGSILYPVYLGEKAIPLTSNGSVDTGIIFIDPSDSATISGNKIASGVSNDYDVFALKNGNFEYAHVANPNVKAPSVETLNKKIGLRLVEKAPGLFNFNNFKMDFNLGEEEQQPLSQDNKASTEFNKSIFGPNNPNESFSSEINMDGNLTNSNDFGMRRYSAIDGTSSADVESDGTYQSDWMDNIPLDSDDVPLTHIVGRKDVDCVRITFIIEQLYQKIITETDIFQGSSKTDALQINFSIFASFEGVPESIFPAEETKISYYGIVTSFYAADTDEITLPSYDDIIDDYPNETKASLCKKFPRKIEVRKNDFETNSTRMGRGARVFQVIEVVKEKFSYPFSAVIKTYLDARTFKDPPNKQFNLRLRKIKIPSNYFPLDLGGRDKRFVEDAEDLGTRIVYDGDWDGSFKIGWTDNPAWILYDLLTDQRYGIGNRIDSFEDINIFNLYKIGRYCDAVDSNGVFVGLDNGLGGLEPRFSCNVMLDASNNGFESIKDIASVFNGMAFWANGRLDFFADQPKEVMMYFNNGNVFDGIFNYQTTSKSSLFNTADVVYLDKRDNYTAKKETIVDEDGLRQNGLLRRNVTARGATSRSQASRLARYIIYSNKLEREVVNFKTSAQGLMLSIGDIIEVQDELKNFEANYAKILNIQSVGDKFIEIENKINTNSVINNHSGAFVIVSTGQDKLVDLYNNVEAGGAIGPQELNDMYTPQVRKLKITGATELTTKIRIGVEDSDGYLPDVQTGTLINLDLTNRVPKQYRVLSINPEETNLYGISATEYRKEKFDIIESPINFALDEAEPYNIGIPENENKPLTEPLGFTSQVVSTQYSSKIDFEITGDGTGNETAYKLSIIHPNAKVDTKRIMKQGTIVNGNFVTTGTFNDVIAFGTYTFEVESISSEEIFGGRDYASLKQNYDKLSVLDTDNDGLSDYDEINIHGTDPNDADSDNDGLEDGAEINTHGTDPLDSDTDKDGLSDGDEVAGTTTQYGTQATDPLDADSDDDGLSDGDEVNTHDTNPLDTDSDDDTFDDALEVAAGSDPNDPNSLPGELAAMKFTVRGSGTNGANGQFNFDNGGGSSDPNEPHYWNSLSEIDTLTEGTIGGKQIWALSMGSADDYDDFGDLTSYMGWRSEQNRTEAPFPWRVREWNWVGGGYTNARETGMPLLTDVRMGNNNPVVFTDLTTNVRSFDFTNNYGYNLATGKYVYSGIMNGAPLWGLSGATHDEPFKLAFHFYEENGSGYFHNRMGQDSSGVIVHFNGGVTEPLPWTVTSNGGQWSGIGKYQNGDDFIFTSQYNVQFAPQFTNFKDGDGNSVTP